MGYFRYGPCSKRDRCGTVFSLIALAVTSPIPSTGLIRFGPPIRQYSS
jgi:hypothetical protein